MTAMRADVPGHPRGVFDNTGRPSQSEAKRTFDELWSGLSAQRTRVCQQVFGISPLDITEIERKRLQDAIPPETRSKAAQDYRALTNHLLDSGSQGRKIGQEAFWIKSIASWEKQQNFPKENQATQRRQEER
jgi:hypothetical protein